MSIARSVPTRVEQALALRLVASSRPLGVLSRILVLLAVATLLALVFVPWVQTSVAPGVVIARSPSERRQMVESPIDGRVAVWHVREGSVVHAGDSLVDLVDNDLDFDVRLAQEEAAAKARIAAIGARADAVESRIVALEQSRAGGMASADRRVAAARERSAAAEETVKAADAALTAAGTHLKRQSALASKGLSSERAAEVAEMEYVRARAEAERARASLRAAAEDEKGATGDRGKVTADAGASIEEARATLASVRADEAMSRAELARIEVRVARQATRLVVAPRSGMVQRVSGGEGGEQVKSGDPLLSLVPEVRQRAVEIYIDGNDVPLVHEGRRVRLQFEGWPAVQWSGWPSVAIGTFGGVVASVDSAADEKARFRAIVVPGADDHWPEGPQLRQGARVTGWILLDEVRLGWELWRRFNGFPPTSTPPDIGEAPAGSDKKDSK